MTNLAKLQGRNQHKCGKICPIPGTHTISPSISMISPIQFKFSLTVAQQPYIFDHQNKAINMSLSPSVKLL